MIKRRFIPENRQEVEHYRKESSDDILKIDKRRQDLSYGGRWLSIDNLERRKNLIADELVQWLKASPERQVRDIVWALSLSNHKEVLQVAEEIRGWTRQERSIEYVESLIRGLSGDEMKEWMQKYDEVVLRMRKQLQINLEIAFGHHIQKFHVLAEQYGVDPSQIRGRLEGVHIETVDPLLWRAEGRGDSTACADNQLIRVNLYRLAVLEQQDLARPRRDGRIEHVVGHEMAHLASRTMYQETVVPSTSFVARSGGLGFEHRTLEEEDRSRFFWLNEATTELVTNIIMDKPMWEIRGLYYSQEVRLLKLLIEKIRPPFMMENLFRAYFEGFTDAKSQRASHFRIFSKVFRENFGNGFLVRLGKYLNDGGKEAMANALRLADSSDEKALGKFLGINQ